MGFIKRIIGFEKSDELNKLSIPFGIYHGYTEEAWAVGPTPSQSLLGFIAYHLYFISVMIHATLNPFWDLSCIDFPTRSLQNSSFSQSLLGFIEMPRP